MLLAAKQRYPGYEIHSVIYPKYRTVGELVCPLSSFPSLAERIASINEQDKCTHEFVKWLYRYILDLERDQVDTDGSMVHTSVILLGHS